MFLKIVSERPSFGIVVNEQTVKKHSENVE